MIAKVRLTLIKQIYTIVDNEPQIIEPKKCKEMPLPKKGQHFCAGKNRYQSMLGLCTRSIALGCSPNQMDVMDVSGRSEYCSFCICTVFIDVAVTLVINKGSFSGCSIIYAVTSVLCLSFSLVDKHLSVPCTWALREMPGNQFMTAIIY